MHVCVLRIIIIIIIYFILVIINITSNKRIDAQTDAILLFVHQTIGSEYTVAVDTEGPSGPCCIKRKAQDHAPAVRSRSDL